MPTYWLQDPSKLPEPKQGKRPTLRRKPLFDLVSLQQEIQHGRLGPSDVQLVTVKSKKDRRECLPWTTDVLLHFITCLRPFSLKGTHDFHAAEWCLDEYENWYACDAYSMCYDSESRCRDASGLQVYLKFSLREDGGIVLVVVSLHPST